MITDYIRPIMAPIRTLTGPQSHDILLRRIRMASKPHILKVTGVPADLVRLLDERAEQQHFAGRSEYIRELIRRDVLSGSAGKPMPTGGARSIAEAETAFARIERRGRTGIQPLAPGADSREAIYGDRA
jgi:hypothetical protein